MLDDSSTEVTIAVTVGSDRVVMESRSPRFPEAFRRWVSTITPEDHPDQWAKGSRFRMIDDAGTDPAYFPSYTDAVAAAFQALAADVLAEIENAQ